MKPSEILFIFLFSVGLLLGIILIFPNGNIPVTRTFSLHFYTQKSLSNPWPTERKDIKNILNVYDSLEYKNTSDTISTADTSTPADSFRIDPSRIARVKHHIQFPADSSGVLDNFFSALDDVRINHTHIHILHYGDSQIEGDRITSVIRERFQTDEMFGGCGPGLIPVRGVLQGSASWRLRDSGNWTKYSNFQKNKVDPPHHQYGLHCEFFRFIPYLEPDTVQAINDSLNPEDSLKLIANVDSLPEPASPDSAWFEVKSNGSAAPHTRYFSRIRLFYANVEKEVALKITINDHEIYHEILTPGAGLQEKSWPMKGNFKSIRFDFKGDTSPDIYDVVLDCKQGISVDNLGLRGSAVTNFTGMSPSILASQIKTLNTKLIILQFGVNVVPNVVKHYKYYENMMYRQILALKRAVPGIPVLVIGVSDMARKEETSMESYPNIELIRNAQRNAAFRSASAFWDLYEAMGGHNSMVSWVENDPPYAEKDYTHYNPRGAKIIGQMIYDALIEAYYKYKDAL